MIQGVRGPPRTPRGSDAGPRCTPLPRYGRELEAETLLDRATILSPRDSHIASFHDVRSLAYFSLSEYDIAVDFARRAFGSPTSAIRLLRRLRLHWAFLANERRPKQWPASCGNANRTTALRLRDRSYSSAMMRASRIDSSKDCA